MEPRPRVLEANPHEQEAFVIPEADIVLGPEFLDEPAFVEDGLRIAAHRVKLETPDALDERARLQVRRRLPRGREIPRQPLPQIPRLADINDSVETVAHHIHPRTVRHVPHHRLQIRTRRPPAHGAQAIGKMEDGHMTAVGGRTPLSARQTKNSRPAGKWQLTWRPVWKGCLMLSLSAFVVLSSLLLGGVWWVCRNDSGTS